MAFVYWLYNEFCVCIWRHGYIGITKQKLPKRFSQHKSTKGIYRKVPKCFDTKVIFRGSIDECDRLERILRPRKFIGWNILPGGSNTLKLRGAHNMRFGTHTSEQEKQKIRDKINERGGIVNPVPKGTARTAAERAAIRKGTLTAGPLTTEQRQRQIANTQRGEAHHAYGKPMKITNPSLGKDQFGTRNPFFGKRHTNATRQKIQLAKLRHGRSVLAKRGQFDFNF